MLFKKILKKLSTKEFKIVDSGGKNTLPPLIIDEIIKECDNRIEHERFYLNKSQNKDFIKCNHYIDSSINTPRKIQKVTIDNEVHFLVSSYRKNLYLFDKNWNFLREVLIYGDLSHKNKIRDIENFYLDIENDLLFVLTRRHYLKIFKFSTQEEVGSYGVLDSSGNYWENKLYTPKSIVPLENGNVLIANYYGYPDKDENGNPVGEYYRGTIIEVDWRNNSVVRVVATYKENGSPFSGNVSRPKVLKKHENTFYVSDEKDFICAYTLENGEFVFQKIYKKPQNVLFDSLGITDFDVTDKEIIVACNNLDMIVGLDKESGVVTFSSGFHKLENFKKSQYTPNALYSPMSVVESDGKIFVADSSNWRIQEQYRKNYQIMDINIPKDIEIIHSTKKMTENNEIIVHYNDNTLFVDIFYRSKV